MKVYDGRVEGFYALFLVRPSGNKLAISEQRYIFGNPKIDSSGYLSSAEHSGPFVKVEQYRVRDGEIYRYLERNPLGAGIERVSIFNHFGEVVSDSVNFSGSERLACAQTVAAKAYFYSGPTKELKTRAYLVKGDLARIVDSAYGGEWLKVEFSKTKPVIGWLHASQAVVGAPDTCKAIN